MDIQTTKIELVKLILSIDNKNIVEKIFNLIKSEQSDFWNELSRQEQEEIRLGIKQLDAGQRISFDDFLKKVS
jgi:hypothetical protein